MTVYDVNFHPTNLKNIQTFLIHKALFIKTEQQKRASK